nr:polysaccharide pyruvyl transferase family protein [Microbacterium lemovicicum]
MRVLLGWTDDISPNLGVRALGRGSQDFLRRIWPDAEFEYMNYGTRPTSVSWSTRGLAREWVTNRRGMKDWLRSFDLYWDTRSGDSFADIYGMPRHTTMSLIHELAVRSGVPAVMAPQTIGPFGSRRARVLARRNLRRSRIVLARDPISAQASAALGRPVDLTTTDMVFGITQPEPASGYDVLLNVSGLLWNSTAHGSNIAYREQVRHIIDGLAQRGRSVTLLPHVLDSADPDNDVPVSRQIREDLGGAVGLAVPKDLEDARQMIAGANLVIGARMHACLNALSTGTPTVAMAYSRKFAPLMAALEWPHVVSLAGDEAVSTRVLDAIDDPDLADRALESQGAGQRLLGNAVPLLEAVR